MPGPLWSYGYMVGWEEERKRNEERRKAYEAELQDPNIGKILQRIDQEEQKLQKEQERLQNRRDLARQVLSNIKELKKLSDSQIKFVNLRATHPLYPLIPREGLEDIKADKSKFEHPIEKRLEKAIACYEKNSRRNKFSILGTSFSGKEQWAIYYYLSTAVWQLRQRAITQTEYERLMNLSFRTLFREAYSKLPPKLKEDVDAREIYSTPSWNDNPREGAQYDF